MSRTERLGQLLPAATCTPHPPGWCPLALVRMDRGVGISISISAAGRRPRELAATLLPG
jgi:hypothetical protein